MSHRYDLVRFLNRYSSKDWERHNGLRVTRFLDLAANGGWLAGGAVRRLLLLEDDAPDYDLFFPSEESLQRCLGVAKGRGRAEIIKEDDRVITLDVFMPSALSKRDLVLPHVRDKLRVQLIRVDYYKHVEELINSFDFTVCQFAIAPNGDADYSLWVGEHSLWDLARKRLAVNRVTYPVSTLRRLLKYTRQGFTACNGCLQTLATAVADNPELQERLGVFYVD